MKDSLKQARVLVTGATGFIGKHLCRKLVESDATIFGLSRSASSDTVPAGVIPIAADVTRQDEIEAAFQQVSPTHVLHLAAAGVTEPFLFAEVANRVNVTGTVNVLQASLCVPVGRFIQVGTCYESSAGTIPISTYAASKFEAWRVWRAFVDDHAQLESIALRLFHVYGPEQPASGLIMAAIRAALRGDRFEMTPGEQQRDFIYIDDVVDALSLALTAPLAAVGTLDVGTGSGWPVRTVVQTVFDMAGGTGKAVIGAYPYRDNEIMRLVAETEPIARMLGWQARTNLNIGLLATIDWQRQRV